MTARATKTTTKTAKVAKAAKPKSTVTKRKQTKTKASAAASASAATTTRNLSPAAIALLLRVRSEILAKPELYNQRQYCNSAFCLAGHAVAIARPKLWKKVVKTVHEVVVDSPAYTAAQSSIGHAANKLIGWVDKSFIENGGVYLFGTHYSWPTKFTQQYDLATTAKQRAEVGARVIDDYIKTDGWLKAGAK